MNDIMLQGFEWYLEPEDGLWRVLADKSAIFSAYGITSIWLPPAYKGHKGKFDSGYGVYDLYDLGEFDQKQSVPTKYGTKEEYLSAIASLREAGIKVYVDVVLNHRIGADDVERFNAALVDTDHRNRKHDNHLIEAWTSFTFDARKNYYSDFKWNHKHFKAIDYDRLSHRTGIFLFEGKGWDAKVSQEYDNYDYLMGADVDVNHPEIQRETLKWLDWYYETVQYDGIRLDAIKHIDADFIAGLIKHEHIQRKTPVVGEYWSGNVEELVSYLESVNYTMSLFDVPLHYSLESFSKGERIDFHQVYMNTLVSRCPQYAVTFVDNHDTQIGQSLQSWVNTWFRYHAYALILLRPTGTPCIFYQDIEDPLVKKMMILRKRHSDGELIEVFERNEVICWAFTQANGYVVIASIQGAQSQQMTLGIHHANEVYVNIFNPNQKVYLNQAGCGCFEVDVMSVAIYVNVGGCYDKGIL